MRPDASRPNAPDSRGRYVISRRKFYTIAKLFWGFANGSDLLFSQNSVTRLYAFSSLAINHVFHIVGLGSISQMRGIYARSVITRMQDKVGGLMSIMQGIRKAVSPHLTTVDSKDAITFFVSTANPNPTRFSFRHIFPKTLCTAQRSLRRVPMNKPSLVMCVAKTVAKMFFGATVKLTSPYHGAIIP